ELSPLSLHDALPICFAALAARGEWDSAAALVEGEFLEGLALPGANQFETWLGTERALWRAQGLNALVQCAEAQLARGDTAAAARAALGAVGLDPTSEPAARAAMRALTLAGDRAAALRVAERLARALRDALDDGTVATARAVPADRERQWSAVTSLLAAGLADAPGLASAPSAALASLGTLDPDLDARFRGGRVGPPSPAVEVRDGFVAAVIAAAEERPLLLVVDDAQWLDAASLALLPALARDSAPHSVLLLLGVAVGVPDAQRFDELQARLGRDLEGAVIRLGRLDHAA